MKDQLTETVATVYQQDQLNFDTLYETYWPRIHQYVGRLLNGRDAEDITQEVFLKVAANMDRFRQEAKVSTWIYRIATNAVTDRLRQTGSTATVDRSSVPLTDAGELLHAEKTFGEGRKISQPEGRVVRREMNRCIRSVVDALPEKYRTVVVLSEMEGLKNREIAEILGVTLDNVKVRLHRGRALLRQALAGRCNFYWDERNELACEEKDPREKTT
ncbi:MAG TPA: sigma-70 family RNA polymerase sigma factor [Patescibacteria group bacterium]|nr:sigma-70 family RNA polymerase sigma factor [Patescibacteria group bacterium]